VDPRGKLGRQHKLWDDGRFPHLRFPHLKDLGQERKAQKRNTVSRPWPTAIGGRATRMRQSIQCPSILNMQRFCYGESISLQRASRRD
jgi:hypothetical protein